MKLIDLSRIRTHKTSQRDGFEEMAAQIFRSGHGDRREFHRIEGSGGDGGVEAYIEMPNGKKVGMQAKFFEKLQASQWNQIEKSVRTALKNHPEINKYLIYVSKDRTPTQDKTWARRVKSWKEHAKKLKIPHKIEFVWQGESEILQTLGEDGYRQIAHYWFGTPQFSLDWLAKINESSIADLEKRYSPNEDTETETGRRVLAFLGARETRLQLEASFVKLVKGFREFENSLTRSERTKEQGVIWESGIKKIHQEIDLKWPDTGLPELKPIRKRAAAALEVCEELRSNAAHWSREFLKAKAKSEPKGSYSRNSAPYDYAISAGGRFASDLSDWIRLLDLYSVADFRFLLVDGKVGTGKSHLLASVTRKTEKVEQPTIFLLGEYFTESGNPWQQLNSITDWQGTTEELLSSMNQQAGLVGLPGLICVDALNESEYRKLWMSHLNRFARSLEPFENLKLIVSCRSDFREITLPEKLETGNDLAWVELEHFGFGEEVFEAIEQYFKGYKIRSKHFPPVLTEFRNPLFLRLFCEAFEGGEVPSGPLTLRRVMETRVEKLSQKIRRDLDCSLESIREAISTLANEIYKNGGQAVAKAAVKKKIDRLGPSRKESKSLFHHLKSNGIIVEVGHGGDLVMSESEVRVRFPFERFSDYFIASNLLSGIDSRNKLISALKTSLQFAWIRDPGQCYENRGIATALSILVPEQFGIELFDAVDEKGKYGSLKIDFLESLPWRSPESFNKRSEELLLQMADDLGMERFYSVVLGLASIPGHPFNANFLDHLLRHFSLPDREELWTIPISDSASYDEQSKPNQILDWVFRVSPELVSNEQALLASRLLSWFFSSNYRWLRRRSTIAAIRLLNGRSDLTAKLVEKFASVDDPYVSERVFAVACGVAMRENDSEKLSLLARIVYDEVFAEKEVCPHILIRDYAQSILEIALYRGCLPAKIKPEHFRPPYHSKWPRIWSQTQAERYDEKEGWGSILFSIRSVEMGMYGDFGRYVMGALTRNFSKARKWQKELPRRDDPGFSGRRAGRWVLQRVKQLGWTPGRFDKYERRLLRGRQTVDIERNKVERISKKYQWIALYELLGYLSDHFRMVPDWGDEPRTFKGAWQVSARDFDPSCAICDPEREEVSDGNAVSKDAWVAQCPDPFEDENLCRVREKWVLGDFGVLSSLIESSTACKLDGKDWLALEMFKQWDEPEFQRLKIGGVGRLSMWLAVRGWLIKNSDLSEFLNAVRKRHFWGNGCDPVTFYREWLGEYPWGASFEEIEGACEAEDWWIRGIGIDHMQTVCEWGSHVKWVVPSPQVLKVCNLHWSGHDADFLDENGNLAATSPGDSNLALLRKDLVINSLRKSGYELVWGVLGERSCYDEEKNEPAVWKQKEISAVFRLDGSHLFGGITKEIIRELPGSPK